MPRALVWFRRDLRVADHTALHHACQFADEGVVGVFVASEKQWKQHHDAAVKVDFWLQNIAQLSAKLEKLNIPLLLVNSDTYADCPAAILKVMQTHDCHALFANREYETYEVRRDRAVRESLHEQGLTTQLFHDRVIVPPRDIQTKDGRFYSVYTPYRRVWDSVMRDYLEVRETPGKQKATGIKPSKVPSNWDEFEQVDESISDLWPAGEKEAERRLLDFLSEVEGYGTGRDVPSIQGTSRLSPYLAAGVISPRQCVTAMLAAHPAAIEKDSGVGVWISELTWRDFYTHVLWGFPRVSQDRPFKEKTDQVDWRLDPKDLLAWKSGMTGYPIVDAGMRQLNQTGWMHNRLRMVTAMFLTKNLLVDWREGEKYFMEKLVDGDLAANNGGWQWSASTGTDSVPYFRIFNPFSQSKRFDPDGLFIKQYCPELKSVPATQLHDVNKFAKAASGLDYPSYIVDYKEGRERALAAFKAIR